jgi:hypothetical protein
MSIRGGGSKTGASSACRQPSPAQPPAPSPSTHTVEGGHVAAGPAGPKDGLAAPARVAGGAALPGAAVRHQRLQGLHRVAQQAGRGAIRALRGGRRQGARTCVRGLLAGGEARRWRLPAAAWGTRVAVVRRQVLQEKARAWAAMWAWGAPGPPRGTGAAPRKRQRPGSPAGTHHDDDAGRQRPDLRERLLQRHLLELAVGQQAGEGAALQQAQHARAAILRKVAPRRLRQEEEHRVMAGPGQGADRSPGMLGCWAVPRGRAPHKHTHTHTHTHLQDGGRGREALLQAVAAGPHGPARWRPWRS